MTSVLKKIVELGYELPNAPTPVASYVPAVRVGDMLYTSGALPMLNGKLVYLKKIKGTGVSLEAGYKAAQLCALNVLSIIHNEVGLDNVVRIVKITGFVNSAEFFTDQPKIINGASDLLVAIFGENGKHARSAVGVSELPLGASVELEMIVQVR